MVKHNNDRIIVSFTSWKKRIHLVASIVRKMMSQTLKPDKIVLNLSSDEFKGKESDLPTELVSMQNEVFEINWVKENTRVYKKNIPTMEKYPDDIIVSIDDDIDYPDNLIEVLYRKYIMCGCRMPVTSGTYKWRGGLYSHYGCFTLFKKWMIEPYFDDLYKNVVMKYGIDTIPFADPIFTYSVLLSGNRYAFIHELNMSEYRRKSVTDRMDAHSKLGTEEYKKAMTYEHDIILDYIEEKYKKTYDDFIRRYVVCNITTWRKRDKFLPKMLESLKKQTLRPNRIVLWLSEDEYDRFDLPKHITKCLDDGLLTDIMWVKRNTYCHKRYECFRVFNDCYNIFMDDDMIYTNDAVEKLVNAAENHKDCVIVSGSCSVDYDGFKIKKDNIIREPSYKNAFMGGYNCFPPRIMPEEIFDNIEKRDIYVKKCDESWLRPILIKHNIKTYAIENYSSNVINSIEESKGVSVWNENRKIIDGVMREKERCFFNSIKINGVSNECISIWPKISINQYKLTMPQDIIKKRDDILKRAAEKKFNNFNIDEPKTWCEKMQWLQLYDPMNFMKSKCADKIRVHQYSMEKLGKDICVPILHVYDEPKDIDLGKLPENFVLKCNHGYNMNLICKDKSSFDLKKAKDTLSKWLNTKFGEDNCQYHYLNIEPKCFAEKFLSQKDSNSLTDYKFICFEGKPLYVQVINGRHEKDFRLNYYDMDFNFVNISRCDVKYNPNFKDKKPLNFELMKEYAKILSEDFHFVRVDFYEVDGVVYLGELTFTPATCFIRWTDPTIDRKFGDLIKIDTSCVLSESKQKTKKTNFSRMVPVTKNNPPFKKDSWEDFGVF